MKRLLGEPARSRGAPSVFRTTTPRHSVPAIQIVRYSDGFQTQPCGLDSHMPTLTRHPHAVGCHNHQGRSVGNSMRAGAASAGAATGTYALIAAGITLGSPARERAHVRVRGAAHLFRCKGVAQPPQQAPSSKKKKQHRQSLSS